MEISASSTAEAEVVRRQIEAYNARDIDAFMAHWADDAQVYAWPSELMAADAAAIRARHVERFREPDLFARVVSRMAVGNLVIDREVVTRNFPEGRGTLDVIAIYEVEGDRIARAWFKFGAPMLDQAS